MLPWTVLALTALFFLGWRCKTSLRRRKQRITAATSGQKDDKQAIEPLQGFDLASTAPHAFRPFRPIYHITMGIQASDPSELIVIDRDYADKISYRRGILAAHPAMVAGAVPEGAAAVRELYRHLLAEHLPARYPGLFAHDAAAGAFRNLVTGDGCSSAPAGDADVAELLRTLGAHVEDDLFLLVPTPAGHRLVAFLCCHPSGFDPSAKLGRVLSDIHAPVPAYDKIGPSMERFFAKLEVGQVVKRLNWGISTEPQLFTPGFNHVYDGDEVAEDEDVDMETTRVRVELQALSRLPQTQAVLFSFKSYLYPVSQIKAEGLGPQLADAIEGLKKGNAPGMWTYKGAVRWGKSVCDYLRS